jgi:hypothetical protein
MNLQYRIDLLERLGNYMLSDEEEWKMAKDKAFAENSWFIPSFIDHASSQVAKSWLDKEKLKNWTSDCGVKETADPKSVGIVMAGNIPLVGFHDWLSVFISGHKAIIKRSGQDRELITQLAGKIAEWDNKAGERTIFQDMLKGCDAYIATGSNNTSRYFDYYFAPYPHIIRRNKTAVAVIDGNENPGELERLADDVYLYFGRGCRNVTKLYVPDSYDFEPMLNAFRKYNYLSDHNKYMNNYDYNLALLVLNKKYYMTNGSILLTEAPSLFSPISQLHYEYYNDFGQLKANLEHMEDLQCVIGHGFLPFGQAQYPALSDFADGLNTLEFLARL